jgi:hypothetical protein
MTDIVGSLQVESSDLSTPSIQAIVDPATGRLAPQNAIRLLDGTVVGSANPLPTTGTGIGTSADTAWSGSGTSTVIAALKAIWILLKTGTVGLDRSANAPAGPGAATSFTYNATTVNLLTTIAANPNRHGVEINNTTGALVVVVIDDGANTAGTVSIMPLAPGPGANQGGADFIPPNELGRLRVFGTTGTYCYARET